MGERKEGNDFEKRPLVFTVDFIFVTELKSQKWYTYLHTRSEGKKSNVCLNTSCSYGLTLTVHLLDGHFILLLLKKFNRKSESFV